VSGLLYNFACHNFGNKVVSGLLYNFACHNFGKQSCVQFALQFCMP
jgi:hypothetical protein